MSYPRSSEGLHCTELGMTPMQRWGDGSNATIVFIQANLKKAKNKLEVPLILQLNHGRRGTRCCPDVTPDAKRLNYHPPQSHTNGA